MYRLSNNEISIVVDSLGAELKSLRDSKTGQEYMWSGDPGYWKRTSPILFPLVGNYKNKEMLYGGKRYPMPQHGFARDMKFALISQTADTIWFGVSSTEETLQVYPFPFRLELGYRLSGRAVEVLWRVINTGMETMYFSIGGHPAFRCPVYDRESQTDCYIQFDTKEQVVSRRIGKDGLATDIFDTFELTDGYLSIRKNLFDNDALVIENHQVHRVSLTDSKKQAYVTVSFDVPLFGIWSPPGKDAPFICIEPWYGRCDHQDFNGTLEKREWGNTLEGGKEFNRCYKIEIGS